MGNYYLDNRLNRGRGKSAEKETVESAEKETVAREERERREEAERIGENNYDPLFYFDPNRIRAFLSSDPEIEIWNSNSFVKSWN